MALAVLPLGMLLVTLAMHRPITSRGKWIARQLHRAEQRGLVPPHDAEVSDVSPVTQSLPMDGWLRLGDGTVIYTVTHSRHQDKSLPDEPGVVHRWLAALGRPIPARRRQPPGIGDITLLFAPDGRILVNSTHACHCLHLNLADCPDLPALLAATNLDGTKPDSWQDYSGPR